MYRKFFALTLLLVAALVLGPRSGAAQDEIPLCLATVSSTSCGYVFDAGDCFINEQGVRMCRTIQVYRWEGPAGGI